MPCAGIARRLRTVNAEFLREFLCHSYIDAPSSGSKSYATCASYAGGKEGPMLDLLFLGGGTALLVLLIAYARLTSRL